MDQDAGLCEFSDESSLTITPLEEVCKSNDSSNENHDTSTYSWNNVNDGLVEEKENSRDSSSEQLDQSEIAFARISNSFILNQSRGDSQCESVYSEYVTQPIETQNPPQDHLMQQPASNQKVEQPPQEKQQQQQQKQEQSRLPQKNQEIESVNHSVIVQSNIQDVTSNQPESMRDSNTSGMKNTKQIDQFLQKSALHVIREQNLRKPTSLNVMVVGANNLGKSSFIEAFLHRKFQKDVEDITTPTRKIKETKASIEDDKSKLEIVMIDTPGFSLDGQFPKEWLKSIKSFLKQRFDEHETKINLIYANKKSVKEAEFTDFRVNLCLYFFTGPRISEHDLQIMKELQKIVNIIPILAKGDCITKDEILQIKENLNQQAKLQKIQFFDCLPSLRNNPQQLMGLQNGVFGVSPPFVLVSSVQRINLNERLTSQYVRVYPWGTCQIEDPSHSDFELLYEIMIGYIQTDLRDFTELLFKRYLQKRPAKKEPKSISTVKEESSIIPFVSTAIIASLIFYTIGYISKKIR